MGPAAIRNAPPADHHPEHQANSPAAALVPSTLPAPATLALAEPALPEPPEHVPALAHAPALADLLAPALERVPALPVLLRPQAKRHARRAHLTSVLAAVLRSTPKRRKAQ